MTEDGISWYKEFEITSVSNFLEKLPEQCNELPWGYRGLARTDWLLQPSLYRGLVDCNGKSPLDQVRAYRNLEIMLLEKFKAYALPHVASLPNSDIAWLALAQHHGLPTRLLDWTESPLVALFFALYGAAKSDGNCDSVVWAILVRNGLRENQHTLTALDKAFLEGERLMLRDQYEQFEANFGLMAAANEDPQLQYLEDLLSPVSRIHLPDPIYRYHPSHTTSRITAQQGFFTVQGVQTIKQLQPLEVQFGLSLAQQPDIDLKDKPAETCFRRYIIRREFKSVIQRELDAFGMNHYAIYPDLEGIAKKLREDVQMQKRF